MSKHTLLHKYLHCCSLAHERLLKEDKFGVPFKNFNTWEAMMDFSEALSTDSINSAAV